MVLPYIINLIIKEENLERFNLDSLQYVYSRGSPLHKNTIETIKQRLVHINYVEYSYFGCK